MNGPSCSCYTADLSKSVSAPAIVHFTNTTGKEKEFEFHLTRALAISHKLKLKEPLRSYLPTYAAGISFWAAEKPTST